MAPGQARSFVFAIDFRVSQSDRMLPVLEAQPGRHSSISVCTKVIRLSIDSRYRTRPGRDRGSD